MRELEILCESQGISRETYEMLQKEFNNDKKYAIDNYLYPEYADYIASFTDFVYYYLTEKADAYFHNLNCVGYTEKLRKLLAKRGYHITDIDYDKFQEDEHKYGDILCDILVATINIHLNELNKNLIGINIGKESIVYIVIDKKPYFELKNINSPLFKIIDIYEYERMYKEIYEVLEDVKSFKKGEFIMGENNRYTTLYRMEYSKNVLDTLTEEERDTKLEIII